MSALKSYLEKEKELTRFQPDSPEHDAILEDLDDLWWAMSVKERQAAEKKNPGKWIRVGEGIVCPFCGHLIENFSAQSRSDPPPRCDECMTDTIPGEFA